MKSFIDSVHKFLNTGPKDEARSISGAVTHTVDVPSSAAWPDGPQVRVHVQVMGAGQPALLVHGWRASAADLWPLASRLVAAGYSAWLPDLPGHGQSQGAHLSIPLAAATLRQVQRDAGPSHSQPATLMEAQRWHTRWRRVSTFSALRCSRPPPTMATSLAERLRVAASHLRLPMPGSTPSSRSSVTTLTRSTWAHKFVGCVFPECLCTATMTRPCRPKPWIRWRRSGRMSPPDAARGSGIKASCWMQMFWKRSFDSPH